MLLILHSLIPLIKNATKTFRRVYRWGLLLAAIISIAAPGRIAAQGRGLDNVTNVRMVGIPKLTEGAQAWTDYDGDMLPDLLISGKDPAGTFVTKLFHNTGLDFEDNSALMPGLPQIANSTIIWVDYDRDGRVDLFLMGNTGTGFVTKLYHHTSGQGYEEMNFQGAKIPDLAYGAAAWILSDEGIASTLVITGKSSTGPFTGVFACLPTGIFPVMDNTTDKLLPGVPAVENSSLICNDFNNDGTFDVLIAGDADTGRVTKLYLSSNKGYSDASSAIPQLVRINQATLAAVDYDGDKHLDLLMLGQGDNTKVDKLYHNVLTNGWNDFEEVPTGIEGVSWAKTGWSDFDKDKRPDLLMSGILADGSPFVKLYRNTAAGFLDSTKLLNLPRLVRGAIAWGDYNNDTWPDVLYCGVLDPGTSSESNGEYVIRKNNGNGTFTDDTKAIAGTNPLSMPAMPVAYGTATWVDYENSGNMDLFFMGQIYDGGLRDTYSSRYFFVNDGKGTLDNTYNHTIEDQYPQAFPLIADQWPSLQDGAAVWGDYNNDGLPDLLMIGQDEPSKDQDKTKTKKPGLYLFTNEGRAYMKGANSILPAKTPGLAFSSADWGDYDNDGWKDLILTGSDGTNYHTLLYHNESGKSFTDASALLPNLPQLAYSSVAWGDFDNDSRPDLILTGKKLDGTIVAMLYHNTTTGFVDASSMLPNLVGVNVGAVNWIDFDNDGLLDLFITGDSGAGMVTKLYHNKGLKTLFEDQSALVPGLAKMGLSAVAFGDYDQDGFPDLAFAGSADTVALTIYHNKAGAGFELSPLAMGAPAASNGALAWIDYNHDSWTDLMTTGSRTAGPAIALLQNTSTDASALLQNVPFLYDNGSAAWGDYDNDGLLDLLVTGSWPLAKNSVLYHNTGTGFEDQSAMIPNLSTEGLTRSHIAWADYDNDGRLDLAMASDFPTGANVRLYHNIDSTGNGFEDANGQLQSSGQYIYSSVSWADYDNDGRTDLFISGYTPTYVNKLYRNTPTGFVDSSAVVAKFPANAIVNYSWADYDRDGRMDVLLTGGTFGAGSTALYHNTGSGFENVSDLISPIWPVNQGTATWGDYDGDGWPDLFIAGRQGQGNLGRLYHNNGHGFTDASAIMPGLTDLPVLAGQWADYDNDGRPDLLGITDSALILYHNTGNGFEMVTLGAGLLMPEKLAIGDYDNDGRVDVFVGGQTSKLFHNQSIIPNTPPKAPFNLTSVSTGNSTITTLKWDAPADAQTPQAGLSYNVYVSDVPGSQNIVGPMANQADGFRRVVQSGNSGITSFTLQELSPDKTYYWSVQAIDGSYAASPFAREQQFTTPPIDQSQLLPGLPGLASGSAVWGDYDNDKKLDLFISGDGIDRLWSKLYHNTGSGFEDSSVLMPGLPGLMYGQAAWADYDNDGKLDLLVTGQDSLGAGTTILYHNTGSGFENKTSVIPGVPSLNYSAVAFGDYDNDGFPDLVLSGGQTGGNSGITTRLYHNTGNGAFEDASALIPGQPSLENGSVNWIDFNKDRKLDLFITGYFFDGMHSYLYQNTGNGFTDVSTLIPNLPGVQSGSSVWADYDLDGYPDLFVTGQTVDEDPSSAISRLYHNNNGAGFTDVSTLLPVLPGFSNSAAAWGDYDNDGRPDLIISGFAGAAGTPTTLVYLNTKIGFTPAQFANLFPQAGNSAIALGDYDKDGRLDLFISGLSGRSGASKLLHNLSLKTNAVPQAPVSLGEQLSPDGKTVTLTWQAAFDQDTPGEGLNYNVYVSDMPGSQNVVGAASDISTGTRLLAAAGNSQGNSFTLKGLVPGKTYYWSAQAIDPSLAGSVFAAEQTFRVSPQQVRDAGTITTDVYPNPGKDKVTIKVSGSEVGKVVYKLTDSNGRLLQLRNSVISGGISTESFDIRYRASGIYFIQVSLGTGTIGTLKVLKQ